MLVAPYFTDLGLDVVRRSGWVDAPWDWSRIRASHIAIFQSDDDPYVSQQELAALAEHVQAEVHVLNGAGHFGNQDSFPELSAYILGMYGHDAPPDGGTHRCDS